ncbi:MAG TPA: hypothetical protein VFI65_03995 [Streptosporangiaceae bacterium]|nr:hypothetical protein [Streptosporangiaceae bacterium]
MKSNSTWEDETRYMEHRDRIQRALDYSAADKDDALRPLRSPVVQLLFTVPVLIYMAGRLWFAIGFGPGYWIPNAVVLAIVIFVVILSIWKLIRQRRVSRSLPGD